MNPSQIAISIARIPAIILWNTSKYFIPILLLTALAVGMNHGTVADTRADAHLNENQLVNDIDYGNEQPNPMREVAPDWMTQQRDPHPVVKRGLDTLMLATFTLAEEISLITYDTGWIQAWWASPVLSLLTLIYMLWMMYELALQPLADTYTNRGDPA